MILPSAKGSTAMQAKVDFAVCLGCSDAGPELECCILLPHESPLGTLQGQRYRPTDEWPATFLCLRHMHMCVRSADNIRVEIEVMAPNQHSVLWRIVSRCGHENCDRTNVFYIGKVPDLATIRRRIMRLNPTIPCENGGHSFAWREDRIEGTFHY